MPSSPRSHSSLAVAQTVVQLLTFHFMSGDSSTLSSLKVTGWARVEHRSAGAQLEVSLLMLTSVDTSTTIVKAAENSSDLPMGLPSSGFSLPWREQVKV